MSNEQTNDELTTTLARIKADASRVAELTRWQGDTKTDDRRLLGELHAPMDHAARACERYINVVKG